MNESEPFFNNLSMCIGNLLRNEQSVIMGQIAQAIKESSVNGKDTAKVKTVIIMEIEGPRLACVPVIETSRTVKTRNECTEEITADTTPDMFKESAEPKTGIQAITLHTAKGDVTATQEQMQKAMKIIEAKKKLPPSADPLHGEFAKSALE